MTLDLDDLIVDWDCPPGELRARVVTGRDGDELLQLRVDLGVMQMFPDGRPDGERYRGLPTVREFITHEVRLGGHELEADDWQELERELLQFNYRRMAFATVADDALRADDEEHARRYLRSALTDVEACLADLELLKHQETEREGNLGLLPTLLFDRARLQSQLDIVEGQFETAIEQAEAGAVELDALLAELGYEEEQRADDPGLRYLRKLSEQLRREYGITKTLNEQLRDALDAEDFETAAELRDELNRRRQTPPDSPQSRER
jgi:hypothetical protein